MTWKEGDPFTDGSFARECTSRDFWEALHGVEHGPEGEHLVYWWQDKPHQVAAECCEGWRRAEARVAELEKDLRRVRSQLDAFMDKATFAD